VPCLRDILITFGIPRAWPWYIYNLLTYYTNKFDIAIDTGRTIISHCGCSKLEGMPLHIQENSQAHPTQCECNRCWNIG